MNCVCELCSKAYVWKQSAGMSQRFCAACHVGLKRIRLKRRAVEYLGGVCTQCRAVVALPAFDFHHRDPSTKTAEPARLLNSAGWERLKEELDKCDLVCSNCHRIMEASALIRALETLDPNDPVWKGRTRT